MFRSLFRSRKSSTPRTSRQLTRRPFVEALEDRNLLAVIHVGPARAITTIQGGVNAAANGDEVQVDPATYTEQVTITKSILLDTSAAAPATIIQAPAIMVNNFGSDATNAIVAIGGSAAVNTEIVGFTIEGPVNDVQQLDAGVYVAGGATANINNNLITNIANTPLNPGSGDGIRVGRETTGTTGHATIVNNTITAYQGDGISVLNGSTATVTGNTVTGRGPLAVLTQNGIVIASNSVATVSGNIVSQNQYTGAESGPDPTVNTQAMGILLDQAGLGTSVTNNTVNANDIGIYSRNQGSAASPVVITGNLIGLTTANNFEGAIIEQGNTFFASNTIKGGIDGLAIISFANPAPTANSVATLSANGITGASRGIHIYVDTTGSTGGFVPNVTVNASSLAGAGGLANQVFSNLNGIQIDAGTLSLSQALIFNNTGSGVNVTGGSVVAVPGNVMGAAIDQNAITGNGTGITIGGGAVGLIYDNNISGNTTKSIVNNTGNVVNANGDYFVTQANTLSPLPSDAVVAATFGGSGAALINFLGYINAAGDNSPSPGFQSNTNERAVDAIYVKLLNRFPETAGKTSFVVGLNNASTTVGQVAATIASSAEYRTGLIVQYYQRFLNRTPSAAEIQGQLNGFGAGQNQQQIEAGILSSAEFFGDSGGTNSGFVSNLYLLVLGRPADAGGLAGWVNALNGGASRTAVALNFITSNESSALLVNNNVPNLPTSGPQNIQHIPIGFYETFLGRVGSQAEVNSWFASLANPQPQGGSIPNVIGGFLGSSEFVNSSSL